MQGSASENIYIETGLYRDGQMVYCAVACSRDATYPRGKERGLRVMYITTGARKGGIGDKVETEC